MFAVDHFASTVRGLFSREDALPRGAEEVPLTEAPIPPGGVSVVEVAETPSGRRVPNLEIVEPLPGGEDTWQTREVELVTGMIYVGALGGRFANRSLSGRALKAPALPGDLLNHLNTGGVLGLADSPDDAAVKVRVLGGVEYAGRCALLSDLTSIPGAAAPTEDYTSPGTPIVLVAGSDMEVGKTTCAASLAFSLRAAGIRVSYAKLTGTGRMRDVMEVTYGRSEGYFDSRRLGWDFVDAGLATTFEIGVEETRRRARLLLRHAAAHGEIVLAEIADAPNSDGSIHVSTDPWLRAWLGRWGLVICACDTLDSTLTVKWLLSHFDLENENVLISGRVAGDPSASKEVERITGLRVVSCTAPSRMAPHGGEAPGGALADWVIRHIMSLRKAIE